MRGWAISLVVLVLGAGVWFLGPWSDTAPELGDPVDGDPAAKSSAENEPRPDDLAARSRTRIPDRRRDTSDVDTRFTVPVELLAFVVDEQGTETRRLDGFHVRLTAADGAEVLRVDAAKSGHKLRLGVGSYVLHVSMAKHIAPAPAEFAITEASRPFTLRFPFHDATAILQLEVLHQTTKARVENCRLTIETHVPGESQPKVRFVPRADTNPISIQAALGQKLVVRVEAKGFAPSEPVAVEFDGSSDKVERQVFLTPTMKFTGVEFHVTDETGATVQNVSVFAEMRQPDRTYKRLWRRRHGNATGIYKLPEFAPGDYRIELRSIDADGAPTLHLAHEFEFQITGNEHILRPIVLPIGGTIELRLTDTLGNTIGKDVSIELTHPDGKVRESLWRPLVDGKPDLKSAISADFLAKDGHARLDQAIPKGPYKIKLRWDDGPEVIEHLMVRSGEVFILDRQLSK
jgi:hypothetical protein